MERKQMQIEYDAIQVFINANVSKVSERSRLTICLEKRYPQFSQPKFRKRVLCERETDPRDNMQLIHKEIDTTQFSIVEDEYNDIFIVPREGDIMKLNLSTGEIECISPDKAQQILSFLKEE